MGLASLGGSARRKASRHRRPRRGGTSPHSRGGPGPTSRDRRGTRDANGSPVGPPMSPPGSSRLTDRCAGSGSGCALLRIPCTATAASAESSTRRRPSHAYGPPDPNHCDRSAQCERSARCTGCEVKRSLRSRTWTAAEGDRFDGSSRPSRGRAIRVPCAAPFATCEGTVRARGLRRPDRRRVPARGRAARSSACP